MKYMSTRGDARTFSASEVIVKGISDDGGLFVPSSFPHLDGKLIDELAVMSYPERTAKILSLYLDDFTFEELLVCANKAYSRFDGEPCPLVKVEDGLYMLELWHGPSGAVEDTALSILPYLIDASKKKLGLNDKTLILSAENAETGKSVLEGFKGFDDMNTAVFYSLQSVTRLQRLELVTQEGLNVYIAGINGDSDSVQTAVKNVLNDKDLKEELESYGYSITSVDSVNWGVIAPQIAYYISAYLDLADGDEIEFGDKINFVLPTGNFANAIAGYYAFKMGLPVNKFILASNANNALTECFNDGVLDANRDLYRTMSPSMDTLLPGNLERLIFEVCGRDCGYVRNLYSDLVQEGRLEVETESIRDGVFEAGWADEEETKEAIFTFFDLDDYVMDPHTAVGASVYNDYSCETDDETPTVILSTANPFKFTVDVLGALGGREKDPFKAMGKLQAVTGMECPEELACLNSKDEIHTAVIDRSQVAGTVLDFVRN